MLAVDEDLALGAIDADDGLFLRCSAGIRGTATEADANFRRRSGRKGCAQAVDTFSRFLAAGFCICLIDGQGTCGQKTCGWLAGATTEAARAGLCGESADGATSATTLSV